MMERMVERQNKNDGKNNDEKNKMTKYEGWKEEW